MVTSSFDTRRKEYECSEHFFSTPYFRIFFRENYSLFAILLIGLILSPVYPFIFFTLFGIMVNVVFFGYADSRCLDKIASIDGTPVGNRGDAYKRMTMYSGSFWRTGLIIYKLHMPVMLILTIFAICVPALF